MNTGNDFVKSRALNDLVEELKQSVNRPLLNTRFGKTTEEMQIESKPLQLSLNSFWDSSFVIDLSLKPNFSHPLTSNFKTFYDSKSKIYTQKC